MTPYYEDDAVTLWHGDCLDVMATLPDASVDAVVTDPPYGLGFMGREWDDLPPGLPWARECLRVLKPGGHLLAFGGSRTWHRLAVAVEDAGFEVRDSIAWLYGSGFPKSLDVSKAVDKLDAADERRARALEFTRWFRSTGITRQQAAEVSGMASVTNHYFEVTAQPSIATADIFDKLRPYLPEVPERIEELVRQRTVESENYKAREVVGIDRRMNEPSGVVNIGQGQRTEVERKITNAHTAEAARFAGWGTALKPAFEPIVVARKPLAGTVAANVLAHGTGAINVDGCRVGTPDGKPAWDYPNGAGGHAFKFSVDAPNQHGAKTGPAGRWPTNVVLDGHAADELDATGPHSKDGVAVNRNRTPDNDRANYSAYQFGNARGEDVTYGGEGGPSRFFPTFRYQAKAPTRERVKVGDVAHPTVKPLELMRWLVRLVTPPGGLVLEPFAGSGTTVEAAILEGFQCIAIEREADYLPLIRARIDRNRHTADGLPAAAEALALFDFEEPA